MILIADYGLCNLRSIAHKLAKAGIPATVSSNPAEFATATRIILPGVGHFAAAMRNLRQSGLAAALTERVIHAHIPILGICLGMQLFARSSEEGNVEGLGWLEADVVRLKPGNESRLKIPHVGWNSVRFLRPSALAGPIPDARFYFTHSYHLVCHNPADPLARTQYGIDFVSAVEHQNILGFQCHPEKSHHYGMDVLIAFCKAENPAHA